VSLNIRILIFFAVFLTLGMTLLVSVIYDSYKQSTLNNDIQALESLNEQITNTLSIYSDAPYSHIKRLINNINNTKSGDHQLMVIDDSGTLHSSFDGKIPTALIERFTGINNSGHYFTGDMRYVWARSAIPDSNTRIISLYAKKDDGLDIFISEYALPFFISAVLVLWMLAWLSLFVGSLFKKLNKQKAKLVEQTEQLAEARDKAIIANQAKSTFLANMSHEIRTPLTAIIGYSDVILSSDQSKEERLKSIKTINSSSKHVLNIINEILDLSKIEADKLEIEKLMVSPMSLINEISGLMTMQANEKCLNFKVIYETPMPETIITDPTRLKQILINLFSNAVKFTSNGHVHIEVSCQAQSQKLTFRIIDTGIGMTKDQCGKIFNAFQQADETTSRKYGGTGLGLSLSKKLIELLEGTISVSSVPNKGSVFTFNINTGRLDNIKFLDQFKDAPTQADNTPIPIPSNIIEGNVLLAEDTDANADLFSMFIRKMGANVSIVENGQDAVEQVLTHEFDLILMDMQMPVMNGLDATRTLRDKGYNQPIVALTANISNEYKEQFSNAGCSDFLEKPIDRHKFVQIISHYLKPTEKRIENSPIISSLLEEEPDFADLVIQFISALPRMLKEIQDAAKNSDWQLLEDLLHNLKGAGGNYGYIGLSDLSAKLEFQVINRNTYEVQELIARLEEYCHRVIAGQKKTNELLDGNNIISSQSNN